MLITAERDGYFGLRAKPALCSSAAISVFHPNGRPICLPKMRVFASR